MNLIHYGSPSYDPTLFNPIKNRGFVKPRGGLWTSPINSKRGWKYWCERESFRDCNENNSFKLVLNLDARVFVINSLDDLKNAPLIGENIDFELLAKTHDAIWLTEIGLRETHLSYPINLYGWDCETVLILNPHCFTQTPIHSIITIITSSHPL